MCTGTSLPFRALSCCQFHHGSSCSLLQPCHGLLPMLESWWKGKRRRRTWSWMFVTAEKLVGGNSIVVDAETSVDDKTILDEHHWQAVCFLWSLERTDGGLENCNQWGHGAFCEGTGYHLSMELQHRWLEGKYNLINNLTNATAGVNEATADFALKMVLHILKN